MSVTAFPPPTPSTQALGDTAASGTSTLPAASDHKHGMPLSRYVMDGWFVNNISGTGGPTAMTRDAAATIDDNREAFIVPRAGTATLIAIHSNAARTAGTMTLTLVINGTPAALTAVLDGTNTTFKATTGSIALAAGDIITLTWTTAGWTPTTADFRGMLEVTA